MAEVLAIFEITPKESNQLNEENSKTLAERIAKLFKENNGNVKEIRLEPLVFGLKRFIVSAVFDESKGTEIIDKLNEQVLRIENIESSNVTDVSRVMDF